LGSIHIYLTWFPSIISHWIGLLLRSHVRMDKQDGKAYILAFNKTFQKCQADHPAELELGLL